MVSQLSVYNQALLQLKESPLASIGESRESRRVLDALWDDVLKEMLEAGFWKFAMRTISITQDETITPAFGPTMAFNKPSDWVKTYLVSLNDLLIPPIEDLIEESNLFFTDAGPLIYVRYVSNDPDDGGLNLDKWTARFTKAMAFELAYRAAPKATGSSDTLIDRCKKDALEAKEHARTFEALREPSKPLPGGRWNQARNGRRGPNWSGNYRIG